MSSGERRKKKLSVFFRIPILLGLFLAVITVLIYFIYWPVGVILTVYLGIYFIFTLYMYLNNSEILRREMIAFATNYDQMQGVLLRNFDVPYALLDETGKIEWMNDAFASAVQKDSDYRRSITTIFPSIRRESLPKDDKEIRIQVEREGSSFMAQVKKLNMADLIPSNTMLDEKASKGELYSLFLIDDVRLDADAVASMTELVPAFFFGGWAVITPLTQTLFGAGAARHFALWMLIFLSVQAVLLMFAVRGEED